MAKRPRILNHKVPVLLNRQGSRYIPDLLIALQDGQARIACLTETADLDKTIKTLGRILEELKDLRWEQTSTRSARSAVDQPEKAWGSSRR